MLGWSGVRIHTIGHSTRTLEELVAALRAFDVSVLADVRTVPRSRHNPQFDADALRAALPERGLRYVRLPRLGGLRRPRKDSTNGAWRNASFRGFADHMESAEFETGLAELRALAAEGAVALMCAEAVPWRCHRSLIADALTARGAQVVHIRGVGRATPHRLTSFAAVDGSRVRYPVIEGDGIPLAARAPFHLEATVRVLQRRPANRVDRWDGDRYLRVLSTPDGLALVDVANRGTVDAPDVRLAIRSGSVSNATQRAVRETMHRVLGLDLDPDGLQQCAAIDPALGPTARALRGMRPPRFPALFEAFANVVPFQQVSLDAGVAIVGRLVERFGESLEHDGRRCFAFPSAQAIAGARLASMRSCGLSERKAATLRGVARAIASGALTVERIAALGTDAALSALIALPGIGPWSAALVLLRGLGRTDVFPPGDVGAARGLRALLRPRPELPFARVVERFGDRRGYLYFCALGASLLEKQLIHPAPRTQRAPAPRRAASRAARVADPA